MFINKFADIEDELQYGKNIVGRGGCPNRDGTLQCDAAVMDGRTMKLGAVAALEGYDTTLHQQDHKTIFTCI